MSGLNKFLLKTVTDKVQQVIENKIGGSSNNRDMQRSNVNELNYDQGGGYPGGGGYPPQQNNQGYPQQGGYPSQGYPPQQQQQQQGYNPYGNSAPSAPGYPGGPSGGAGYPGGPSAGPGYPGGPSAGPGYPGGPSGPGYPGGPGYPQGPQSSNPPPIGFNAGGGGGGGGYPSYPEQQQQQSPYPSAGYPGAAGGGGGYPPQQSYPSTPAEAPARPTYPGMGSGYAPARQDSVYSQHSGGMGHGQHNPAAQSMLSMPSVVPAHPFDANADAETLRKAMKGFGCNNTKVTSVLCARTNAQRQQIATAFKCMYGKDLLADLKSELHGDFEDLILALMETPARYDAMQLHKAMAGLGTKESVLIEIMTSRTNAQIQELRATYKMLYKSELERDLIGETSGCFKRLLVSLCAGGRDESNYTDPLKANQDAHKLYKAGEGRLGTDESCFNAILASQNFAQLRMVFDEYHKIRNHPIEKAIQDEFSGDIRDGLLALCSVIRNRPAYFAQLLHASMKGLGTRDNDLIRVVVTRCEQDMADVRVAFQHLYNTSLENMISGDCSGSYKQGLITLVQGNRR